MMEQGGAEDGVAMSMGGAETLVVLLLLLLLLVSFLISTLATIEIPSQPPSPTIARSTDAHCTAGQPARASRCP